MQSFYAPAQARHAPSRELQNGEMVPYAEKAERAAAILSAIAPPRASEDHGLAPIEAVHSAAYLA